MDRARRTAVTVAVAVQVGRFLVLLAAVLLAPLVGVTGWWIFFVGTAACTVYAVVLVSRYRLWRRIGATWRSPGRGALPWLVPFAVEAALWTVPSGLVDRAPGSGLWTLSLLLVGVNEELVSRGVVLERLGRAFPALPAVAITAALFGLQHLSAFATTSRGAVDVLGNVAASACFGFALAAYQARFHWIAPLIVAHAGLDLVTVLSGRPFGDTAIAVMSVGYLIVGVVLLRRGSPAAAGRAQPARSLR